MDKIIDKYIKEELGVIFNDKVKENNKLYQKAIDELNDVIKGINDTNNEGIKHNNFYGTYVLGPVLARNPELLKHLIKEVLLSKNNKFKFKKFDLDPRENKYEYIYKEYFIPTEEK